MDLNLIKIPVKESMNKYFLSLIILTVALMTGCASNSGVTAIGVDTYMVTRQAASGFSGSGTLKAEAFSEAREYCVKSNKNLQIVSTNEAQPPFILGNFPKAEVQFMCLSKFDIELQRPKLKENSDISITVDGRNKISNRTDVYLELKKIKELLNDNILTQQEFESLKQKILSQ